MDIPEKMQAIEIAGPGGPEVLRLAERPVPRPGPGEVLVRVAAAGVNRPDVLQRMGLYPPPPGASDIPGLEIAGIVVDAGEGAEEVIGGSVCALVAGGGYAEYCVAPLGTCLPVPEVMRMTEAAAMPETLFTVWVNLFERGFAADGDTVLVHGGTSGIGTMAIKLGSLFGLQVIVTCGSDGKCDAALKMGAIHAINYRTAGLRRRGPRVYPGPRRRRRPRHGRRRLCRRATLPASPTMAATSPSPSSAEPTAEIAIPDIMRRRLTLTGSTLRARDVTFKTMVADEIARTVWPYAEGNRLKPVIDSSLPAGRGRRRPCPDGVGRAYRQDRARGRRMILHEDPRSLPMD